MIIWIINLIFVILSLPAFAEVPGLLPSVQKMSIDLQCAQVKTGFCKTNQLNPVLTSALSICETMVKSSQCQELKKDPGTENSLKRCELNAFCEDSLFNSYFSLKGCIGGYWSGTKDTIKGLIDLVSSSYDGIKNNIEQKNLFIQTCNKSIACKRDLVKEDDRYYKMSDVELNKYSAAYLLSIGDQARYLKARMAMASQPSLSLMERAQKAEEMQKQREALPPPNERSVHETGLMKAGEEWLRKQGVKLECFNAEAQAEMLCYGVSQIVDPLMAAGLLSKSPKLGKLLKTAELKVDTAVIQERRIGSNVSYKSTAERHILKEQLLHAQYTTEAENQKWIALAGRPRNQRQRFVEIENSKMKFLNDNLKDKDLVTAVTNMHKQITMEEFQLLAKKYPNLKFSPYSDFKSIRYSIEGDLPPGLEKEINTAFSNIQRKFTDWTLNNKLVRSSDKPEDWFKMGTGELADEASAAARFARGQPDPHSGYSFNSPIVKKELATQLQNTDQLRKEAIANLGSQKLLQRAPSGEDTLSPEVFEVLRKSETAKDAADKLKKRFALTDMSEAKAQQLLTYSKSVDQFSPSLYIAKREVASLDTADMGGFSVDFVGMGSHNLYGTAAALAGKTDLSASLLDARKAEKQVTAMFTERRQLVKEISEGSVGKKMQTICSGDDCVGISKAPMSQADKQSMINSLANRGDGANVRVAFIQPGIASTEARSQLATHGEGIEKYLRARLEGQLEPQRLKAILFAVDMQTKTTGTGSVSLMTAHSPNIKLSAQEKSKIQGAFAEAVKDMNKNFQDLPGYKPN